MARQKYGTPKQLAEAMNVKPATVYTWRKKGKLDGLVGEDGLINLTMAKKLLPGRISRKHLESGNARWKKPVLGAPDQHANLETPEQVTGYLNETIGDLSRLDLYELQRRNELEKLLLAQIKRRKESSELVEVEAVKKAAFDAGKLIKEQCLAIADRTGPLVAAEPDSFKCRELIIREVNYILEGLSQALEAGLDA